MNITKVDTKGIIILEYVLDNGKKDTLYFSEEDKYDLKNKVRQFKKKGTITFSILDNSIMKIITINPVNIKIYKMIEMYKKEENEQILS